MTFGNHIFTCGDPNCAALVAMTPEQYQHYQETGEGFRCAAGHVRVYRPSKLEKLREEIDTLRRQRDTSRRQYQIERARWRCPFGGCGHFCDSQGSMVRHIKGHHLQPLLLAAEAGPDAHGSMVH